MVYFIQSAVVLGMERRHVISMKNAISPKNLLFYWQEQKGKTSQRGKPSQGKHWS